MQGPENMVYWFIKKFEGTGSGKEEHSFKIKMVLDSKANISMASQEIGCVPSVLNTATATATATPLQELMD